MGRGVVGERLLVGVRSSWCVDAHSFIRRSKWLAPNGRIGPVWARHGDKLFPDSQSRLDNMRGVLSAWGARGVDLVQLCWPGRLEEQAGWQAGRQRRCRQRRSAATAAVVAGRPAQLRRGWGGSSRPS